MKDAVLMANLLEKKNTTGLMSCVLPKTTELEMRSMKY